MESMLRKYLWALDNAVVVLSAFLCAHATSAAIESSLVRRMQVVRGSARPPKTAHHADYLEDVDAILGRNIFCSQCRTSPARPATPDAADANPGLEKTLLPLDLLAIMLSPPAHGPRWSTAIIRDTGDRSAGPYRIGDKIHGAAIVDIRGTRVYLDNAGRTEFLELIDSALVSRVPRPLPSADGPAHADSEIAGGTLRYFRIRSDRMRSSGHPVRAAGAHPAP
jgi:hypothetical protein